MNKHLFIQDNYSNNKIQITVHMQKNFNNSNTSGSFKVADANPITKTRLYNFDPLKPHFYIVNLGFTGVYIIFLISAQKHRLWVLVRTASLRRF